MSISYRFVVTDELQERLREIADIHGWKHFDDLDGWEGGRAYAWNVANGRQGTVPGWVYDAIDLPPSFVTVVVQWSELDGETQDMLKAGNVPYNWRVAVLPNGATQITCKCSAYGFPHRKGSGKCRG